MTRPRTHILCQLCGNWCGNVADDTPLGWLELYDRDATDPDRQLVGWVDYHDCRDGRVRLTVPMGTPLRGRVRLYPTPVG